MPELDSITDLTHLAETLTPDVTARVRSSRERAERLRAFICEQTPPLSVRKSVCFHAHAASSIYVLHS